MAKLNVKEGRLRKDGVELSYILTWLPLRLRGMQQPFL